MKMDFKIIPDQQTPCAPEISDVKDFIKDYQNRIYEFADYAANGVNAVGLAANQCSLNGKRFNHRIVAVLDLKQKAWMIAIDPKIVKSYGMKRTKTEGCLTWKGQQVIAERHMHVDVTFYNWNGDFIEITSKGLQGQIWQHEINHINGVEEIVVSDPVHEKPETIQRNEPCPCGSGKKFKKCCTETKF